MDYEDYSIFDGSADLFDDAEIDLTTVCVDDKTVDSRSLNKIDNKVTAVQAQNNSQPQKLHSFTNTLQPTHLFSDKSDVRIALLNGDAEDSNNENFNLHNQKISVNGTSLDDSFESQPNKRHRLSEYVGEVSDDSNVDAALDKNVANLNIVNPSNYSSDTEVICTKASQMVESNKHLDKNVVNFETDFTSFASSLNKNIVNFKNDLDVNIGSDSSKGTSSTSSGYSTTNWLNHVSHHQEMINMCSQDFKKKIDSGSSHLQTPSTSQISSSVLHETTKIICPFCNIQLESLKLMEFHIDSTHSEVSNDNNTEAAMINNDFFVSDGNFDSQFVCSLCDLDLGDRETLDLHLLTIHENEHSEHTFEQETCPLCGLTSVSEDNMKLHVWTHSADQTVYGVSEDSHEAAFSASKTNQVMNCPVCELAMTDSDLLISHVESHFNSKHQPGTSFASGTSTSNEDAAVKRNATVKKDLPECQKARTTGRQNNDHSKSQEKWIPKNSRENLSYKRQYEQNLERAVTRGQMSVADYHEQKQLVAETDMMGVDNGSTRTSGLIEKLKLLYHKQSRRGQIAYLCSPTDHFSGSFGDKGWGCGYRNFQMILSCLSKNAVYAQRLFPDKNVSIPSIPKIQRMIESAWKKGFDVQGSGQFGGHLVNTSKWIGATEIVAVFSSLGVKCLLADFHAPSAPDGTHPVLLEWISNYFCNQQQDFIPPLFLQHQGHSRTIVGVEKEGGITKLLLFDPGTPRDNMISIAKDQLSWKHVQTFRRTQACFKAKQYQIIEIVGLLTEKEYEESKILKSVQVS